MSESTSPTDYDLWIDGVGVYRIVMTSRLTIGGPAREDRQRLSLLAPLSRSHVVLERSDGIYRLESGRDTRVDGTPVSQSAILGNSVRMQLGDAVEIDFGIRSPLCRTAVLTLTDSSRSIDRLDGVVMLDQLCLIGSDSRCHVADREIAENVALFCEHGEFFVTTGDWQATPPELQREIQPVNPGESMTVGDLRFRLAERLTTNRLMAAMRK